MHAFLACCVFKYWVTYSDPKWKRIIQHVGHKKISRVLSPLMVKLAQRHGILLAVPSMCFERQTVTDNLPPKFQDVFLGPLDKIRNPNTNALHWDNDINRIIMKRFFETHKDDLNNMLDEVLREQNIHLFTESLQVCWLHPPAVPRGTSAQESANSKAEDRNAAHILHLLKGGPAPSPISQASDNAPATARLAVNGLRQAPWSPGECVFTMSQLLAPGTLSHPALYLPQTYMQHYLSPEDQWRPYNSWFPMQSPLHANAIATIASLPASSSSTAAPSTPNKKPKCPRDQDDSPAHTRARINPATSF